MRQQIAAANWKMNLTLQQGEQLLNDILSKPHSLAVNQLAIFAVPFPYLPMAVNKLAGKTNVFVAANTAINYSAFPIFFPIKSRLFIFIFESRFRIMY